MGTLSDIKKLARTRFDPEMKKRGFARTPRGYAYYRKVGDIYHVFWMENVMGAGEKMRVVVTAWVPEWGLQPYDMNDFPNGLGILTGGRLSPSGPSRRDTEMQWRIATPQDVERSLEQLLRDIDRLALPWLDKITTREELVKHIWPDYEKDILGNRYADKAFGRNLLTREAAERNYQEMLASLPSSRARAGATKRDGKA